MITERYTIQTEIFEAYATAEMTITKAEFTRQLAFLREQVATAAREDWEQRVEEFPATVRDGKAVTETLYHFSFGGGATFLTHKVCKPGYHFTTAKERRARGGKK